MSCPAVFAARLKCRSFDYATRDKTASSFAQDDTFKTPMLWGLEVVVCRVQVSGVECWVSSLRVDVEDCEPVSGGVGEVVGWGVGQGVGF